MSSSFVSLLAAVLLLLAACGGGESPDPSAGSLVEQVVETGVAATADDAGHADDAEEPASVAVQTPKSVAVQAPRPSWNFVIPDPAPVILPESTPPLNRAAFDGDLEAVRKLLEQGEFAGSGGDAAAYGTPLGAALMNDHTQVVELLLEQGAPVYRNAHLLLAATHTDDPAIVKLLLERMGEPPTEYGMVWSLLLAARFNLNPAVVEAFLDYGFDVDQRDYDGSKKTALLAAATDNPNPAVIELLLERGANIEDRTSDGLTALHLAAGSNPEPAVIAVLLERGMRVGAFDLDALEGSSDRTALELAARHRSWEVWGASKSDNDSAGAAIAALLLDYGANIEGNPEKDGGLASPGTPLAWAVRNHFHRTGQLLLDRGADINIRLDGSFWYQNAKEGTLLHLAAALWVERVDEGPIGHTLNVPWRGKTTLTLAEAEALNEEVITAKIETIQLLLDRGLDINARDGNGTTPLQLAIYEGEPRVIEFLLERGANSILKDTDGNSPCSIAQDSEDDALAMLFEGRCE